MTRCELDGSLVDWCDMGRADELGNGSESELVSDAALQI